MTQQIRPTTLKPETIYRGSDWAPAFDMLDEDGDARDVSGAAYTYQLKVYDRDGTLALERSTATASEAAKHDTLTNRWYAKVESTDVADLTDDAYEVRIFETNTGADPSGPYLVATGRLFVRD